MMIASSIFLLGREDWFFLGEIRCLDGSLSGGMLKQFLPPCSTLDGETSGYGGRFILQSGADYCLNGGRRRSSTGLRSRGRGRGLAIFWILDGALLEDQRVGVGEIAGAGRDERSLGA